MNTFTNIFVCLAALIIVAFESYKIALIFTPPLDEREAHAVHDKIKMGEVLEVIYSFNRHRICRQTIDRFIVALDTSVVWRESLPGGASMIGHGQVLNHITGAALLPPGHYKLLSSTFVECFEGQHSAPWPDVPFTVEK